MRILVFMSIDLILLSSPVYAKCHVDFFRLYYDGAQSSTMGTADSGKSCAIHFESKITSIEVSQQAKHGSAIWNGSLAEDRVIYTSKAGYKGADSFTITVNGVRRGAAGTSYVTVNMDVQ